MPAHPIFETCPKCQINQCIRRTLRLLGTFCLHLIVRTHDDRKSRRRHGGADPPDFDLYGEESVCFTGVGVQPFDGGAVCTSNTPGDPYNRLGIEAGEIRENLAEMRVISLFKLVLDDHQQVVGGVAREDVG